MSAIKNIDPSSSSFIPIVTDDPTHISKPQIILTLDEDNLSHSQSNFLQQNSKSFEHFSKQIRELILKNSTTTNGELNANFFISNKQLSSIVPRSETDWEIEKFSNFDSNQSVWGSGN